MYVVSQKKKKESLYMWNSIKVLIFKWHTTDQDNITLIILVI